MRETDPTADSLRAAIRATLNLSAIGADMAVRTGLSAGSVILRPGARGTLLDAVDRLTDVASESWRDAVDASAEAAVLRRQIGEMQGEVNRLHKLLDDTRAQLAAARDAAFEYADAIDAPVDPLPGDDTVADETSSTGGGGAGGACPVWGASYNASGWGAGSQGRW